VGPSEQVASTKPRILLVGHLKGIVTLDGLRIFAREVLRALEDALGEDGFEARIMGGYDPPPELAEPLSRPAVRLLGHVEEPGEEFRSATVMLVPNSIPLGVRVRILTGFSYGACIVSHRANAQGIPELEDGRNALLADSGAGLAQAVLDAVADPERRARLGGGARSTYEAAFAPPVAAARIANTLERIARAQTLAPA
jgi:glycosyltransferase involved in cell wall biosynthesis